MRKIRRVACQVLTRSLWKSVCRKRKKSCKMRLLFAGSILMSISLGMLLLLVFENWLRGSSYLWWLSLAVLFILAILSLIVTIMTRLR